MNKSKNILSISAITAALIFTSCGSTPKVQRVSPETVTDLSGYWNDSDVRIAANEIIQGCLTSQAINNYPATHNGKLPVVIVGTYSNRSDEHIDTQILTKKLEAALVNSGKVEFVASAEERQEVRAERNDQQSNSSEETAKLLANETGADYMLKGSVKTIVDTNGKQSTRTYYITTELINIESNKKIWMDDNSSIKKIINNPTTRF